MIFLPRKFAGFKLDHAEMIPKEDHSLAQAGATDGVLAGYVASDKELRLLAFNFSSAESAKAGLSKFIGDFKQKIGESSLTTQEEGQKKKGNTVVGDRIVLRGKSEFAAGESIVWTNGSVLFAVSITKRNDDSPLEFERQFPY